MMSACALVIGINEYHKPNEITDLFGAVADAVDFADWALDPAGGNVKPEHLYFWTSPAPTAPSGRLRDFLANPTRWDDRAAPDLARPPRATEVIDTARMMAETLPNAAPAITRIYVFMAGHGVQSVSIGVERDAQTCFVAGDFKPTRATSGLIPCDDLRRGLLQTGFFSEAVMFFDCCRSSMSLNDPAPILVWPRGSGQDAPFGIGRAAKRGAKAYETPEDAPTRGAFSTVLMEGLRRHSNATNDLTLNDLETYVSTAIHSVLGEGRQFPYFDIDPRNPPFRILRRPVASPKVPINVTFENGAPRPVQLVGSDGTVIKALINGPEQIEAPAGTFYSLETPDHSFSHLFKHDGPEPTNVKVEVKDEVNVQP